MARCCEAPGAATDWRMLFLKSLLKKMPPHSSSNTADACSRRGRRRRRSASWPSSRPSAHQWSSAGSQRERQRRSESAKLRRPASLPPRGVTRSPANAAASRALRSDDIAAGWSSTVVSSSTSARQPASRWKRSTASSLSKTQASGSRTPSATNIAPYSSSTRRVSVSPAGQNLSKLRPRRRRARASAAWKRDTRPASVFSFPSKGKPVGSPLDATRGRWAGTVQSCGGACPRPRRV